MNKYELRKYRDIVLKIKLLREERENLMFATGEHDGQPPPLSAGDPTGSLGMKLADLSQKIDRELAELDERRRRIEAVLATLPEREYNIMHAYYILGHTWERIAEDMHYSLRWIYARHGHILNKIRDL